LFVQLLISLSAAVPFDKKPDFTDQSLVYSFFSMSKGCLRTLRYLLDEAVDDALDMGSDSLTKEQISSTFSDLYPDVDNPFEKPLDEIMACEVENYSLYDKSKGTDLDAIIPTKFTDKVPLSQLLRK